MTPVSINADDYALSPGTSAAILDLLAAGRITGTSVMTASRFWRGHAADLRQFAGKADIGLHFTLTELAPLGPMPLFAPTGRFPALGALLHDGLRRRLDTVEVRAELRRQLDAFEDALGRPPDFVDGHQHVHVLPGIRAQVLAELSHRYPVGTVGLRDCTEAPARTLRRGVAVPKALFIGSLSRGLARQAASLGIPTNPAFTGIYGFRGDPPFGALLAGAVPGTLMMVHPGRAEGPTDPPDAIADARVRELAFLSGPGWPALLQRMGLRLARIGEGWA